MESTLSIGQAPVNLRSYTAPDLDTALNTSTVQKLQKIKTLEFGESVTQADFNLDNQVKWIKEIEHRQDNAYSVREHRLNSLGYAAGTVFLVIIAGMTPKFPSMTKNYRIASAIISGLAVLASTTKAYTATKKWSVENLVKDGSYWIPLYNEIRYIYTAFLAKSGLGKAHEKSINDLNENLKQCKTINDNMNDVTEALEQSEIGAVLKVIAFAKDLTEAAKQEAELKAAKEQKQS